MKRLGEVRVGAGTKALEFRRPHRGAGRARRGGQFYAFMLKHQDAAEFPTDAELTAALGREIHPVTATVVTEWPYQ